MNGTQPLAAETLVCILRLEDGDSMGDLSLFPVPADDNTLHGPVFLQEPDSLIFPLGSEEKKVKLSCEVKGNPRPTIGFVQCLTVLGATTHEPFCCVYQ